MDAHRGFMCGKGSNTVKRPTLQPPRTGEVPVKIEAAGVGKSD